jgi:hypothetical protein
MRWPLSVEFVEASTEVGGGATDGVLDRAAMQLQSRKELGKTLAKTSLACCCWTSKFEIAFETHCWQLKGPWPHRPIKHTFTY